MQSLNFGFSNTIESEVPLDDRTTDVKAGIEFANAKGLLSVGYNGSWYDNQVTAYRFDNPLRYTDIVGGPSVGQMSTWASNNMQTLNLNGRYGLPGRTRASAAVSVGTANQNGSLLPPTVNTALVAPTLEHDTKSPPPPVLRHRTDRPDPGIATRLRPRPRRSYRRWSGDTPAAKESEPDIKRQTMD